MIEHTFNFCSPAGSFYMWMAVVLQVLHFVTGLFFTTHLLKYPKLRHWIFSFVPFVVTMICWVIAWYVANPRPYDNCYWHTGLYEFALPATEIVYLASAIIIYMKTFNHEMFRYDYVLLLVFLCVLPLLYFYFYITTAWQAFVSVLIAVVLTYAVAYCVDHTMDMYHWVHEIHIEYR